MSKSTAKQITIGITRQGRTDQERQHHGTVEELCRDFSYTLAYLPSIQIRSGKALVIRLQRCYAEKEACCYSRTSVRLIELAKCKRCGEDIDAGKTLCAICDTRVMRANETVPAPVPSEVTPQSEQKRLGLTHRVEAYYGNGDGKLYVWDVVNRTYRVASSSDLAAQAVC